MGHAQTRYACRAACHLGLIVTRQALAAQPMSALEIKRELSSEEPKTITLSPVPKLEVSVRSIGP
jgi:hypothetical protein